MKIFMACAAFPPFMDGGGPVSAMILAKTLMGQGHDVLVVNVGDAMRDEMIDGIAVRRLAPLNIYWNYRERHPLWQRAVWHGLENFNPRAFFVMRQEMRRFRPDIVLTDSIENINVATWAAAKSLRLPMCHVIRSAFLLCWKGTMTRRGENCGRACTDCQLTSIGKRWTSRFVDGITGESQYIIDKHRRHGYFKNARYQPIPGAIERIGSDPVRKRTDAPLRIGYIGAHIPYKGLDVLARAAQLFTPEDPVEFVIAGSGTGSYADQVPALFPTYNTRFAGWIDPKQFFPNIDVLVVPSVGDEPFGRVTIEAFSHAVPVIGSDAGGIPETITDGIDGKIYPRNDAQALARHIRQFVDEESVLATFSEQALRSAERYLPGRIGAELTSFLTALAASGEMSDAAVDRWAAL